MTIYVIKASELVQGDTLINRSAFSTDKESEVLSINDLESGYYEIKLANIGVVIFNEDERVTIKERVSQDTKNRRFEYRKQWSEYVEQIHVISWDLEPQEVEEINTMKKRLVELIAKASELVK